MKEYEFLQRWASGSPVTQDERTSVKRWLMPEDDPNEIVFYPVDHPVDWIEVEVTTRQSGQCLCTIIVQQDCLQYLWDVPVT